MRRMVSLLVVLVVCLSLACPAFAASDTFVPSISYKGAPRVRSAVLGDENVGSCLVVTSISDAKEKKTDITQGARDELLDVYAKLSDGSMKPPVENYVIRELVDVSFRQTKCVDAEHTHKEDLAKDGTSITITFDLGVAKTTDVKVLTYKGGEWKAIESVKNNGDGTVTCVFADLCPVAFCVEAGAEDAPSKTGDEVGLTLLPWIVVMVVSLAAIVVLVVLRRKRK